MPAIRTVMITTSPMFRDLITELMADDGNLDVIGELHSRNGLEERLRALAPNLVLIGLSKNEGDEIGLSIARLLPNVKVITFSSDMREAFIHRMQRQRIALHDVSLRVPIDTILGSLRIRSDRVLVPGTV